MSETKNIDIKSIDKEVYIFTGHYRIKGYISLMPNERQTDYLLNARPFVAVTKAEIFDQTGCELFKVPFVNVHRDHIEFIAPITDDTNLDELNTCQIVL
ncbi:hypothetical protein MHK_009155 [Candidatus Magnetomorum sp. HK-1]|nr:hypothetical protein MHK_009155 [Candidatus Magnetomorum sp. HK-1]